MAEKRTYRITWEGGNTTVTGMNATLEQARAYFRGQKFQFGDTEEHPGDLLLAATDIEDVTATCAKCTTLTYGDLRDAYLGILPAMMENQAVWETIQDRSPQEKDAFLFDRFKAACEALKPWMRINEWHHLAASRGIEPLLAQHIWDAYHTR